MILYFMVRATEDGVEVSEREPTDAELVAAAAVACGLDVTTGDARFAQRLHFDWCMRRVNRDPEIVDLSTPRLLATAPNTVATLDRALELGIRTYVD